MNDMPQSEPAGQEQMTSEAALASWGVGKGSTIEVKMRGRGGAPSKNPGSGRPAAAGGGATDGAGGGGGVGGVEAGNPAAASGSDSGAGIGGAGGGGSGEGGGGETIPVTEEPAAEDSAVEGTLPAGPADPEVAVTSSGPAPAEAVPAALAAEVSAVEEPNRGEILSRAGSALAGLLLGTNDSERAAEIVTLAEPPPWRGDIEESEQSEQSEQSSFTRFAKIVPIGAVHACDYVTDVMVVVSLFREGSTDLAAIGTGFITLSIIFSWIALFLILNSGMLELSPLLPFSLFCLRRSTCTSSSWAPSGRLVR